MPICATCGVGYMEGESHVCERHRKSSGARPFRDNAPVRTTSIAEAGRTLSGRYRDAYRAADFLVRVGTIVKAVGVAIGLLTLDNAINSSHFLTDEQRASIIF